jgi:hypothetical protein
MKKGGNKMEDEMAEKEAGDEIKLSGAVTFVHRGVDGKVKEIDVVKNLIVNKGKEVVAKLINGVTTDFFDYIQIGTGTTAPAATDTALQTYYSEGLASRTYEADYRARLAFTFSFAESVTITESGVFDKAKAASPNMLARQTFAGKAMASGESLEVVWTITVG